MTFATDPDVKTLIEMLAYRRPAGSKTERRFIRDYIGPLDVETDDYGNLSKRIGRAPVLWSCHTDTVHKEGGTQRLTVNGGTLLVAPGETSNCLGADDTAGVWLMREMILAKRPGLYVFHRAEEHGGQGSDYIAKNTPNALAGIHYAIALDRRGTRDVITHQGYGRCASDAFADEIAARLGLGYRLDDGGIFTDTANYTGLIAECTNLSVGYDGEHSKGETLDVDHILRLREALLRLDVDGLPVERDPAAPDMDDWRTWSEYSYGHNGSYDQPKPDMLEMVKRNPEEVADLLLAYGVTAEELADEIYQRGGAIPFA